MRFRIITFITFIFLFTKALGVTGTIPSSFYTLTTFEGLPSNTIGAIKKDSLGYIWIGTKQGLCRFDGCEIKIYPAFSEDDIWSIEELDRETLLIGTISSLKFFNRKTGAIEMLDIPATTVKTIRKTGKHSFLAGTDNGLYLVSHGKPKKIFFETGLSLSNHITSIIRENQTTYWFTTADGLGKLDMRTLKASLYRMKTGTSKSNFFTSLAQSGDKIYLGSFNKGVFCFDTKTKQFTPVPGFDHDLVMTMDHYGDLLYVGTNGKGLKILSLSSGHIVHKEKKKHSIGSNTITSFWVDHPTLWIGTQFGGLSYTPSVSEKFSYYTKGDFCSSDYNIRSFYFTKEGNKLIGTRTGLFYISEKQNFVRSYFYKDKTSRLRADIIPYIGGHNGQILVCTYGGGVYIFDEKTLTLRDFSNEEPFQYGCFFHFTKDQKGNLWFATTDGLVHCTPEGKILKTYDTSNSGLTNNLILFVGSDSMDRLWIGSHFGLFLMDIPTGKIRPDCFQVPINTLVKHISEDDRKNNWVCTENGLYKIGPDLVVREHYTKENILPNNKVVSFQKDSQGLYWITTLKEITKYNPKDRTHYTYRRSDGLSGFDFNNHLALSVGGTLWWANEGGLIFAADKETATSRETTQKPLITSYSIGNTEYDPTYRDTSEKIILPESNNHIRFTFSNMNYSLPYATTYEYTLEGHDSAWMQQIGISEAVYSNLPPGEYTFRLRLPGDEKEMQQLRIQVKRSYTFLIGTLAILAVICGLVVYFSRRIWKLKRHMKDERMILNSLMKKREPQTKGEQQQASDPKTENLLNELLTYMEQEKPYLNPRLSINDLALKLKCTETELSQFLNNYMKINFANFINIYRINEIKLRLNKENLSRYTLKTLSEQCGFNSKTTFYRVFKDVTGMTPSEYCKSLDLNIAEK